jgi:secondary thiamine-phosphate synthase enzyme
MERIRLNTRQRQELIDISEEVSRAVVQSKIKEGICVVFCPHTTAGLTINENADPSVKQDILKALSKLVPENGGYTHSEGNSDSHIKSSLLGSSVSIIVADHKPLLGAWQGIFFCEADGPRSRDVFVQTVPGV